MMLPVNWRKMMMSEMYSRGGVAHGEENTIQRNWWEFESEYIEENKKTKSWRSWDSSNIQALTMGDTYMDFKTEKEEEILLLKFKDEVTNAKIWELERWKKKGMYDIVEKGG